MTACCVKLHCIPDYQEELNELIKRAKDTQIYLDQLENRIEKLQKQLDNDLCEIDSNLVKLRHHIAPNNKQDESEAKTPWINQVASVVVKTGASIVTHQPGLTPWGSIFRLFQARPKIENESE